MVTISMNFQLLTAALALVASSVYALGFSHENVIVPTNVIRQGKMFSLFSSSSDSSNGDSCSTGTNFGICTSSSTCKSKGGTTVSSSGCSSKSVCCQIILRCNSTATSDPCIVRNSGTIVMQETGLTTYRRRYRYRRPKGACQLRLDFDVFTLANSVEETGECNTDLIQVGGLSLCGVNTGQHAYFDFAESSRIDLSVRILAGETSRFSIRNTYIPCKSDRRAPANCLQYFTEAEGRVTSFNFLPTRPENRQTNNLDYSVCIEPADGMNQIQWRACTGTDSNPFFISGGGLTVGPLLSPDCTRDWVQIYGRDRYCGRGFSPVTSTVKPFLLNVHFDQIEGFGVALPTDPAQCTGVPIQDPYTGGFFTCDLNDQSDPNSPCTCTFAEPPVIDGRPFNANNDIDTANTGFCLDYVQMP